MVFNEEGQKAYDLMAEIPRDKKGNPLTLEGVIRSVILKNPNRFKYRDDALDLIYCGCGTGVGWIDGRLGDCSPNNYINMPPDVGGQGCWTNDFDMSDSLKKMFDVSSDIFRTVENELKEKHEKEMVEVLKTIEEIDQRCVTYRKNRQSSGQLSWYACNLCVPKGAQNDFRAGAIETIKFIMSIEPEPRTKKWYQQVKNKSCAEEILIALTA
jgi:hypothetical protein